MVAEDDNKIAELEEQLKSKDKNYDILWERYHTLFQFVVKVKKQSCCNTCNCLSCEAHKVLNELQEIK